MSSLSSGAATLSSTLDVAGDVDVNSGKFAVTASDGSLAISSNKFTVAGNTGNTVVAGTLDVTGSDYVEQPELGSCDAVEHAGRDGSDYIEQPELRELRRCRARWMWQATWT